MSSFSCKVKEHSPFPCDLCRVIRGYWRSDVRLDSENDSANLTLQVKLQNRGEAVGETLCGEKKLSLVYEIRCAC